MSSKCNYCVNKEQCKECDEHWKDKFIPSNEVKQYFERGYVGVRGINGYVYSFNTTKESLKSTHGILIDGNHYCPYCGDSMYSIQEPETLAVIGHLCICQGARYEIEYEEKKKELEMKHKLELSNLMMEYADKLLFCCDKLLDIKHKNERSHFNFTKPKYGHFDTLNGKSLNSIDQIIR